MQSQEMIIRERITEIIEPRNENTLSRAYDWLMLVASAIGILPLMFREQSRNIAGIPLGGGLRHCKVTPFLVSTPTSIYTLKRADSI